VAWLWAPGHVTYLDLHSIPHEHARARTHVSIFLSLQAESIAALVPARDRWLALHMQLLRARQNSDAETESLTEMDQRVREIWGCGKQGQASQAQDVKAYVSSQSSVLGGGFSM